MYYKSLERQNTTNCKCLIDLTLDLPRPSTPTENDITLLDDDFSQLSSPFTPRTYSRSRRREKP
jgi:hypothetical protein